MPIDSPARAPMYAARSRDDGRFLPNSPGDEPAWPPLGRALWLFAVALDVVAILTVSYLVSANVLLRTRLLRDAISGSSDFSVRGSSADLRLDYGSAYSILPGRIHVEDLTIRGRERTVEWRLSLDHTDVAVSLADLLRHRFHVTRLRASGFTIRARLRLHHADAAPEVLAALPPIAGFADPPVLDEGPEPPPPTDAHYKLWALELEDVYVEHVREVWIHTWRSVGDTTVRGRWLFRPLRWLDVGPATVEAHGVDVSYLNELVVTGLRGSIDATVHPFDLREAMGPTTFDHVSYDGRLRGRAMIAGALRSLADPRGVALRRCEGPLDTRMVLDHGTFADGTRMSIEATDCQVDAVGMTFEAPIHTDFGVAGDLATVDTRGSALRVLRSGAEQARIASIAATVTSRHLQLAHLFDDARFTLDVRDAETNDVGAWRPLLRSLPSTLVVRSGPVTAGGHAEGSLADGRGRAELRLSIRHLAVERGEDGVAADVTSDAQLDVSLPGGWALGAATIAVDDAAVRLGGAILEGKLAVNVDLRRGTWEDRTFDFSGSRVALRNVSARSAQSGAAIFVVPLLTAVAPRLTLAPSGVSGRASIDLAHAELLDVGSLRDLVPMPNGFGLAGGTGRARLHVDVDLGSGSTRGDGEVIGRSIRARVGLTELSGDMDCVLRARRAGGARSSTDLSGSTLAISHAGTGSAPPPDVGWWGNVGLREATLRTSGGVRFDAKAHLTAKDATPATVLVSQNTGVPGWAADIFRMPILDADAQVRATPSSFEVRSFVARGGSTSLRAEYANRSGRQDGAVLMDLGWIDLGYDLSDGGTGLVLVGPEAWFGRKTATMRGAAADAQRETDAAEQLVRYAEMTPGLRKEEARVLASRCAREVRFCDGASIESLLRSAADAGERDTLSGIAYAPMVVAAAMGGTDGTTLDPRVIGASAEALRMGGESTLDNIPAIVRVGAASDSDAARGKVIAVSGRVTMVRREGPYSEGTLTTDAEPVHFVTSFPTAAVSETNARFRGVFVQRLVSANQSGGERALVLVGAFGH
jgi:hypothetical protein